MKPKYNCSTLQDFRNSYFCPSYKYLVFSEVANCLHFFILQNLSFNKSMIENLKYKCYVQI